MPKAKCQTRNVRDGINQPEFRRIMLESKSILSRMKFLDTCFEGFLYKFYVSPI
jgi:hypothetical protein